VPRIYLERQDMSDELRRLFDFLDGETQSRGSAGECSPPIDVIETPAAIEIAVDLPGVNKEDVHVAFARNAVLIAGAKGPKPCHHADATFHLAERAFGRFARVVRLSGALDAGRARAALSGGELRIVIPRIDDRRGGEIRIPIETD
jgi:HSP20 family protein